MHQIFRSSGSGYQSKHASKRNPTPRERIAEAVIDSLESRTLFATFTADGPTSLIAAINEANNETTNPGADTIVLAKTTYSLTAVDNNWYGPNGLPAITSDITIEGKGATIERWSDTGTPDFRLFYVAGSGGTGSQTGLTPGNLTLKNLTLQGGVAQGGDGSNGDGGGEGLGGAIYNQGTLTVNGVLLLNNAANGGAGSSTGGDGGDGLGGAIFNDGSNLTVLNSTLTQNTAQGGTGTNPGQGLGGGVFTRNGFTVVSSSTLSQNNADAGRGFYYLDAGPANLENPVRYTLRLSNSIFGEEDQSVSDFEFKTIDGGALHSFNSDKNIFSKFIENGQEGVGTADPKLGELADNGGYTRTFLPLPGSSAIDEGQNGDLPEGVTTDQRGEGFARIQGGTIDIGAVEVYQPTESLVVTTTVDEDNGTSDAGTGAGTSLREAIAYASSTPGDDIITFDESAFPEGSLTSVFIRNIDLKSSEVTGKITLQGLGADRIAIDASDQTFLYRVEAGVSVVVNDLAITNTTIKYGSAGVIDNEGDAEFNRVIISGGTASYGSSIISNYAGATLRIFSSLITNNVVQLNAAQGLIQNEGTALIVNSTISGNTASESAGSAVRNISGTLKITNSTITDNRSVAGDDKVAYPGAVIVDGGTVTLNNTIVAGNSPAGASADVIGAIAGSNNLIGIGDGMTGITHGVNGNLVGTAASPIDPLLGTLSDNGGTTYTHALLDGSPAIDAGKDSLAVDAEGETLAFDQRRSERVAGIVDIGAFEAETELPRVTTNPTDQSVTENGVVTFTASATGKPAPTVQWQVSTDGGTNFGNIDGATSTTLSFNASLGQNGYLYRAVFTNSADSATTEAATLTVTAVPVLTGTVTGTLWNDSDADGVFDSNESGTGIRTVFIDANGNGKLDAGERTTQSNAQGYYEFTNVTPGEVKISRVFPSGYRLSNPAAGSNGLYALATVVANTTTGGINLGTTNRGVTPPPAIKTGNISGVLWNDSDGDGIYDSNESTTGVRQVFLDANGNGKLDAGERSTMSDSKGKYTFSNVAIGQTRVSRVFPSGYKLSNPMPNNNSNIRIVNVLFGQTAKADLGTREVR